MLLIAITTTELLEKFKHIMLNEQRISNGKFTIPIYSAEEILHLTQALDCVIKLSATFRCCALREYGKFSPNQLAPESVAAHTNVVRFIVECVLSYCSYLHQKKDGRGEDINRPSFYNPESDQTEDGFSYREMVTAASFHDLAEGETGDIADNGARDEVRKNAVEKAYLRAFVRKLPNHEAPFGYKVLQLLDNMREQHGFSGRLLYVADKASAILATLGYDSRGEPPSMATNFKGASIKETTAMKFCEFRIQKTSGIGQYEACKASEMWAFDFFVNRELCQYDDTGLVTAILVMYSLIVNDGKWYGWRETDYAKIQ